MNHITVTMAKLAGVHKAISTQLANPRALYFDPLSVLEYFEVYNRAAALLRVELPDLFSDLPDRPVPESSGSTDFDGRGTIRRRHLERIIADIDYILEVRAHSELEAPTNSTERERRIFISHGTLPDWREVQDFIERDLSIQTVELAQEPNRGRTVLQKLEEESDRCSYAVVVMTGDDRVENGALRARENVMHEIGYFQGKFGLANVCLLYEEGVNIPSNIHGLVYIPFPRGMVSAAFGALGRELRMVF
jgi:predicted nucleotide-binding protein